MISNLVTLQLKTEENFDENLNNLTKHIKSCEKYSLILAPELCLTGYCYDKLELASSFTVVATDTIKELSKEKTISLTMITYDKKKKSYQNTAFVFSQNSLIHKQSKAKLFHLNKEADYFLQADEKNIKLFDIGNTKVGLLICFELRFINLWLKLKGADIILVPSMWGVLRKQNLEQLSCALAVANQCYVVVANSAYDDMAKSSAVISPFGDVVIDDDKSKIVAKFIKSEITKMRRYIHIAQNNL